MPPVRVCYIDEEVSKAQRYQERIARTPDIECELRPPPDLDELGTIIEEPPDIFLIDYQLSLQQSGHKAAAYQGSTLADAIRDKAPECPIVLVTRESILEELTPQRRRQLTERLQVFDELILKDQIDSDLAQVQHLLKSMSEGYHALRESPDKTWKALTDVLGASIGELEILGEAAPPLEDNLWITTGIAYWIRNVVLEFPGVVYSPIYAATRLGISVDSFESEQVQELLKPAKYSGIFDPLEGRWWKERLSQIASDLSAETGVRGPTNRVFLQAFEKKFSLELSPALCIWDHTPTADQVCYLLRQPVKTRNSLRYYPDRRPEVMDNARVSFLAIQNDVKFNEAYLDPESLGLLERILEQSQP